jgi:hypothetical protein
VRLGRKLAVGVAEDTKSDVPLVAAPDKGVGRLPRSEARAIIEDGRERQEAPAGWLATG